jgi:hypothetical protein
MHRPLQSMLCNWDGSREAPESARAAPRAADRREAFHCRTLWIKRGGLNTCEFPIAAPLLPSPAWTASRMHPIVRSNFFAGSRRRLLPFPRREWNWSAWHASIGNWRICWIEIGLSGAKRDHQPIITFQRRAPMPIEVWPHLRATPPASMAGKSRLQMVHRRVAASKNARTDSGTSSNST